MESFTAIEKINSTLNLSVKDFEDGNINLKDVMEEVNYLKKQITIIRQEMAAFLTGIATLEPGTKREYNNQTIDYNNKICLTIQQAQQVFEENTQRATSLQKTLDDYVERYKKLIPLIQLVNQDLKLKIPPKQEPQVKPPTVPAAGTINNNNTNFNTNSTITAPPPKKAPQRKRTYTKKNQAAAAGAVAATNQTPNTNSHTPILPNTNGGGSYLAGSMIGFNSFQGNKDNTTDGNGSENQPILL